MNTTTRQRIGTRAALWIVVLGLLAPTAGAVRIKDIAGIMGVRDNQLLGYGLVVGLNGTGDGSDSDFTYQSLDAFLKRNGITTPGPVEAENVAAVVVTANLPAFARPGMRIDVQVSSIGDAKNLQGGTLLMTPMKAGDGKIYAVAQGPLSIGGFKAEQGGTSIQENHPTVGQIANGAIIERSAAIDLTDRTQFTLALKNPDFVTATRMAQAIDVSLNRHLAQAVDAASVGVLIPAEYHGRVADFISMVEVITVNPDQRARVVLDERTGTVIIGEEVRISTVAIAHGSLSIMITYDENVVQPKEFSQGETAKEQRSSVQVAKQNTQLTVVPEGVTIMELVSGLNALGVSPRDLIAILQAIKAAGAMQADLEII